MIYVLYKQNIDKVLHLLEYEYLPHQRNKLCVKNKLRKHYHKHQVLVNEFYKLMYMEQTQQQKHKMIIQNIKIILPILIFMYFHIKLHLLQNLMIHQVQILAFIQILNLNYLDGKYLLLISLIFQMGYLIFQDDLIYQPYMDIFLHKEQLHHIYILYHDGNFY